MRRTSSTYWRLIVLFMLAACWDLVIDAGLHFPASITVVILALQLAHLIANPVTCPRCANACDHRERADDDPADEWGYHS